MARNQKGKIVGRKNGDFFFLIKPYKTGIMLED
jgi:hypothetical protein